MTSQAQASHAGMAVDLPKANILKRWGASLLDEVLIKVLFGVLGGAISAGLLWLISLVIFTCQDMPFGGGTSLGRKITDQVLVNRNGTECTPLESAKRNGLRVVLWYCSLTIMLWVDIGLALFHPKGQTSADLILKTQVVDRPYALLRPDQLPGGERPQLS